MAVQKTSPGKKTSLFAHKGLLLGLTGLTIVYQVVYQIFIMRALSQEASDDACIGGAGQSQHCMEVQLFKSWQQQMPPASIAPSAELDGAVDADDDDDQTERSEVDELREVMVRLARTTGAPLQDTTAGAPLNQSGAAWAHELTDLGQRVGVLANASEAKAPGAADPTLEDHLAATGGDAATWAKTFRGTLRASQKEMCADPHRAEREDCVQLLASIERAERSEALAAKASLATTVRETQREMCSEPHRRGRADCVKLLASLDKEELQEQTALLDSSLQAAAESHAAWEQEFVSKAQAMHKQLCLEPQRRDRKDCVEFLASLEAKASSKDAHDSAAWSRAFKQQVRTSQREMCQEPHRVGRSDCVQLMAAIAHSEQEEVHQELKQQSALLESGLKAAAENHTLWESEFVVQAQQVHRTLCLEPQRRNRSDCVAFLATEAGEATKQAAASQADAKEWDRNFRRSVRAAQREMCHEPHRLGRHDCIVLLRSIAKAEHEEDMQELHDHTAQLETGLQTIAAEHAAWERGFVAKAHQIKKDLCLKSQRNKDRKDCAEFFTTASTTQALDANVGGVQADNAAWSRNFLRTMRSEQREMCNEPHRRGRADCIELLASIAAAEQREAAERHKASVALRTNISAELANWKVELKLTDHQREAKRRSWEKDLLERYNISARLTHSTAAAAAVSTSEVAAGLASTELPQADRTSLRQGPQLRWSSVAAKSPTAWLKRRIGRRSKLVVERRDLFALRWAGAIPKVACITAIKSEPGLQQKLKDFIRSFNQQAYEGPSQLVLVYDQRDSEAEELLRPWTGSGYRVKAVAAFGDGPFPSTMAYRFGAWSADDQPEVVVQWALDAPHDRQRLSLQVRALAQSGRPGCLLAPNGTAVEDTLAGEAKWMQQHWHPMLDEQHAVLEGLLETQVVQVHMDGAPGADRDIQISSLLSIRQKLVELLQQAQEPPRNRTAASHEEVAHHDAK